MGYTFQHLKLFNIKKFLVKFLDAGTDANPPRIHQINPVGNRSKLGSGIAVAGVCKVDGAFENRLKEQMHYRRSISVTGSDQKVGNHY